MPAEWSQKRPAAAHLSDRRCAIYVLHLQCMFYINTCFTLYILHYNLSDQRSTLFYNVCFTSAQVLHSTLYICTMCVVRCPPIIPALLYNVCFTLALVLQSTLYTVCFNSSHHHTTVQCWINSCISTTPASSIPCGLPFAIANFQRTTFDHSCLFQGIVKPAWYLFWYIVGVIRTIAVPVQCSYGGTHIPSPEWKHSSQQWIKFLSVGYKYWQCTHTHTCIKLINSTLQGV